MPELSSRRTQLLDAAMGVLAAEGLRGLTHRAVDRRAGVPEGSTSAYWRTRQALQVALTEYVAERLLSDVDAMAARMRARGGTQEQRIEQALELFLRWLGQRDLFVARLELTMAASRDDDLAALLLDHRARLGQVVEEIVRAAGKEHGAGRAEALVATYDGLLLAALLRPPSERRPFLAESLRLLSSSLLAPDEG